METKTASPYRTAEYQESRDRQILAWNEQATARFWRKYSAPDLNGCQTWLGAPDEGYGKFYANGQMFKAHRAAAILRVGADSYAYHPATLHNAVLYQAGLCIGPMCGVHVELGSVAENSQDSDHAKLDLERVEEIRARFELGGVTKQGLADEYGVSRASIYHIINYQTWKNRSES
jgi:hypothetical protein